MDSSKDWRLAENLKYLQSMQRLIHISHFHKLFIVWYLVNWLLGIDHANAIIGTI